MKNKRYTAKITLLFIHRVIHVESTGQLGITELCIFRLWKSRFARMHGKDQPSPRILLCSFLMTSSVSREFLRSSSILLQACMTVVWSRLNIFAISGKDYSSSCRIMYMAIWRG